MKQKSGFTLVETAIVVGFTALALVLITVQVLNFEAAQRDDMRKSAINAMYYALENGYHARNGYYPEYISPAVLPEVSEELWTDPDGEMFGETSNDYIYLPESCSQGQCGGYILRARLEKENLYEISNN